MHTEALAGRGETYGWMSAAAGASGDRVLASQSIHVTLTFDSLTSGSMRAERLSCTVVSAKFGLDRSSRF